MGRLSTHVLDTVTGKPAVGMRVDFSVLENGAWKLLKSVRTNADGRTDEPLMAGEAMRTGEFRLLFFVADHFRAQGVKLPEPRVPRPRAAALRHRRPRRALSRAAALHALELLDVSRKLADLPVHAPARTLNPGYFSARSSNVSVCLHPAARFPSDMT